MNSFLKSILCLASVCAVASCMKDVATAGADAGEMSFAVTIDDCGLTKTCIGGKDGNIYRTCWQEGDRISLNGVPSAALDAEQDGQRTASFVFRGGLYAPFNILYPATESADVVTFPAEQHHVSGSFDPAAAPMWASGT